MTAIEAMIHCLESVSDTPEDGEIHSQNCYDCNGDAHWFAWHIKEGKHWSIPRMCASTPYPFATRYEPYSTSRSDDDEHEI